MSLYAKLTKFRSVKYEIINFIELFISQKLFCAKVNAQK